MRPVSASDLDHLLRKCADFQYGKYKAVPYIKAAIELQNMGKDKAIAKLLSYSKIENNDNKIIVLCRMIFEKKGNAVFRRPLSGGAVFFGGTTYGDWPTEPIEIINGLPFLITRGYCLAGVPEPALMYIKYCESNCLWKVKKYTIPTGAEMNKALNLIIRSTKWKTELPESDKAFFYSQINE